MRVVASTRLDARAGDDVEAVLCVVRVVRAGVVLERLDPLVAADRPDRAPEKIAEHDDEVRRDALRLAVQLLRLVDGGRDRIAGVVRDRGDPPREVVAHRLVLLRRDRPLGLATGDVQEDARVVAALAPRRRARPVDADVTERGHAVRLGERRQEAFAPKPLVDPDPAVETLRAVVGEDEDDRVLVGVLEQLPDEPVDVPVVVEDRVLVRRSPARACGAPDP